MKQKLLFFILVLIFSQFICPAHGNEPNTLIIAAPISIPPFVFVNDQGNIAGMFIDIWRLWSKKVGQQIEFHTHNWNECMEHVKTGKADILMAVFITRERQEWMDFFKPYYESHGTAFYHLRQR